MFTGKRDIKKTGASHHVKPPQRYEIKKYVVFMNFIAL